MKRLHWLTMAAALTLAAGSGLLAAKALGVGAQGPSRTVTINVATGPQGPAGPPGPQGDPGPAGAGLEIKGTVPTRADLPSSGNKQGDTYIVTADGSIQVWDGTKWVQSGSIAAGSIGCPSSFTAGELVINHPGGQTIIWTCLHD